MRKGPNCLDSCLQFMIKDGDGKDVLVLKFYDKILDLLARERRSLVGSRARTIMGAKR